MVTKRQETSFSPLIPDCTDICHIQLKVFKGEDYIAHFMFNLQLSAVHNVDTQYLLN